ncbi:hypothetical protein [Methanosarcina horonobensis]|uniref:hypothetical protein n=1 Tax=Methanosarcina horonobensis TaxID=418008 RepID=UPI00064FFBA7|nr:hypothetical protein [Methanosarcina horonobensis]
MRPAFENLGFIESHIELRSLYTQTEALSRLHEVKEYILKLEKYILEKDGLDKFYELRGEDKEVKA